jgi:hypothetical protein
MHLKSVALRPPVSVKGFAICLADLILPPDTATLPREVCAFLREAERRIDRFQKECRVPGFVPCDFTQVYRVLRALAAGVLTRGNLFCEWGSGFGVVTCLAAMLDFDACGIEVECELVDAARDLARDFDLPVEFTHGSFIPKGSARFLGSKDEFAWLATHEDAGWHEAELDADDFDVIFAFPWPDEEKAIAALFERHAGPGAVLLTYHDAGSVRLRRKTS